MIQESGFVDSNVLSNDYRYYNAEQITIPFRHLVTTGVQYGGENLQVTQGIYPLSTAISPGIAWINGRWYVLKDDGLGNGKLAVLHDAAVQFSRIDRVILRLEFGTERSIKVAVLKGVEAVAPEPPVLTRATGEQGTYEICLAQVIVRPGVDTIAPEDISDTRFDGDLCGLADFAPRPNLQPYINEWDTVLDAFQDGWELEFSQQLAAISVYYQQMQVEFDAWLATQEAQGYAPAARKVYGEALTADISPPAANIPATNPVSGGGNNVQAALNSLFTLASNGKAAVAGAIGSPAASGMTHAQLAAQINANKGTMATNLTAKGVAASGSESMQALANKISSIQTGAETIEEYVILTSGTFTMPAGAFKADFALLGGGGSGRGSNVSAADAKSIMGWGGKVARYMGIAVSPAQPFTVTIGQGGAEVPLGSAYSNNGGATTVGGIGAASGGAGGDLTGAEKINDLTGMWGVPGELLVGGHGYLVGVSGLDEALIRIFLTAGGGYLYTGGEVGANFQAVAGMGGGGSRSSRTHGAAVGYAGSSGRVHIRVYRR